MRISKWLREVFEFEYCSECGGDAEDYIECVGPFGLPFAMCKFSLFAGYIFRHGRAQRSNILNPSVS